MLGGAVGPDLSEWENRATSTGIDLLAILPFRARVAPGAPLFKSLVASATLFAEQRGRSSAGDDAVAANRAGAEQAYRQYFIETGATHLYSFFLCATNNDNRVGTFSCTRHFMDARRMWSR